MNTHDDDDGRNEDRLVDLLADRLEGPLAKAERDELDRLLAAHPEWRRYDLDFAAAAAHLALEPELEEMPEAVKARLIGAVMGAAVPTTTAATRPPQALRLAHDSSSSSLPAASASGGARPGGRRATRALVVTLPWLAAAAAVLVAYVAVTRPEAFSSRLRGGDDAVAARAALAKQPGVVSLAWAQTQDPLGEKVSGDVVWSPDRQEGFMRFRDLPANDPKKAQYQLWIFDAARDERYPVDGGVFDVAPNGETVVAIHAKVPVGKATLFAVTLERPGGVVVSTRERLVALAKAG